MLTNHFAKHHINYKQLLLVNTSLIITEHIRSFGMYCELQAKKPEREIYLDLRCIAYIYSKCLEQHHHHM